MTSIRHQTEADAMAEKYSRRVEELRIFFRISVENP